MRMQRVEEKLDLLISLLKIAYREPLIEEREQVLSDGVSRSILKALEKGPLEAGKLKQAASAETKASKPTIERRMAALVDLGAVIRSGAGGQVEYRASGLFGA